MCQNCRFVRRGKVRSPENSWLYVFGQANPAPTADDGIGRFSFDTPPTSKIIALSTFCLLLILYYSTPISSTNKKAFFPGIECQAGSFEVVSAIIRTYLVLTLSNEISSLRICIFVPFSNTGIFLEAISRKTFPSSEISIFRPVAPNMASPGFNNVLPQIRN